MIALIMAGGKGTRLLEITQDLIPKPMAVINGKPILEWNIDCLRKECITDIYISVGHLSEKIIEYFGDGTKFGVHIKYLVEDEPLGSGGALFYLRKVKEDILVCSGDSIFDVNIQRMSEFHQKENAYATLLTHPNSHPFDSDIFITEGNRIVAISKKNIQRDGYYHNNVNAGFSIISAKALEYFSEKKKCNFEHDFILSLITNNKKVVAYKSTEYIKDAGSPERFMMVENDLKTGIVFKKNLVNKQKAIFIDRDGTINKYKGFINKTEDIEILDGVIEAIKLINKSDYLAIIISNQPVIARGEATFNEVEMMFKKIETLLGKEGAYLDDYFYCPHHPHSGFDGEVKELKVDCKCRKPKIGLLVQACEKYNIDISKCYMVGDTNVDVLTANNASIKAIKIESDIKEDELKCFKKCKNLLEAVKSILEEKL